MMGRMEETGHFQEISPIGVAQSHSTHKIPAMKMWISIAICSQYSLPIHLRNLNVVITEGILGSKTSCELDLKK